MAKNPSMEKKCKTTDFLRGWLRRTCGTCVIFHEIFRKLRTAKRNQPDFLIRVSPQSYLSSTTELARRSFTAKKVIKEIVILTP